MNCRGGANTYDTKYSVYDGNPGANGDDKGTVNLLDSVDVTPGDLGVIEFTANASTMYGLWEKLPSGNHSGIGAVQLESIPEPSSTALLGLGGLALILRRRK